MKNKGKNQMENKNRPECFGTKEFNKGNGICNGCRQYALCKEIKMRKNKLKH